MNIQQIKDRYSMREIVDRCGLRLNRNNYCTCPFHKKDDTPSLKVYEKSFYCFGCGKGGDIIKFVREFHGLGFKEACEWISGESLNKRTRDQVAIAEIERKEKARKEKDLKDKLYKVNQSFSGLWSKIQSAEPYSDEWIEAVNKWELLCYQQEAIAAELEG